MCVYIHAYLYIYTYIYKSDYTPGWKGCDALSLPEAILLLYA